MGSAAACSTVARHRSTPGCASSKRRSSCLCPHVRLRCPASPNDDGGLICRAAQRNPVDVLEEAPPPALVLRVPAKLLLDFLVGGALDPHIIMSVGQAAEAYRRELAGCGQAVAIPTHASGQPRITQSRIWFAKEPATRNLWLADPGLTLTRTQYPAIVCNTGTENPLPMRNSQAPATPDRSLIMSRWAVRVRSSALLIRLRFIKYSARVKPLQMIQGFSETTLTPPGAVVDSRKDKWRWWGIGVGACRSPCAPIWAPRLRYWCTIWLNRWRLSGPEQADSTRTMVRARNRTSVRRARFSSARP
jgi:hypothetical protein